MKAEITGSDEDDGVGVEVIDGNENRHLIALEWDGEVAVHKTDDYPHHPKDRTQEEHALMGQVEEVAKFYAHNKFPEKDILHPMWDPDHVDRGLDAILNYSMEEFVPAFRDYYEALREPYSVIEHEPDQVNEDSVMVDKTFTIDENNRVDDVEPIYVKYRLTDGTEIVVGEIPEEFENRIGLYLPPLEFDDDFVYEDHFTEIIVNHLMAQIRDIYLNMGLVPPEGYDVQGMGKVKIHGDGIDLRPSARADEVLED